MAYLNVRERRIETKIAYVGAELVGKGTNFDQLRQARQGSRIGSVESASSATDEVLSLAWQPPENGRFRDCDVHVKVVAQRGAVTEARFAELLRDTDGVVVVVDADPTSGARNRASLTAVRDVLARGDHRSVPVVLQVNKVDLPDALAVDDVVNALEASALTHVGASAARGEGVFETLETALEQVLDALQSDRTAPSASPAGEPALPASTIAPAASTAPEGGHPLLAALRQVLRETVRDHVEQLESRMTTRLEAALARIEARAAHAEDATERLGRKIEALAVWGAEEKLAVQVVDLLQETDARVQELAALVAASTTKDDLSVITARLDRLRDEVRAELVRSGESRSRADREHLATAMATLKKSVDGASLELRDDVRARDGEATKRMIRVEDALRVLRSETASAVAVVDEKTVAVGERVGEIVEELNLLGRRTWARPAAQRAARATRRARSIRDGVSFSRLQGAAPSARRAPRDPRRPQRRRPA